MMPVNEQDLTTTNSSRIDASRSERMICDTCQNGALCALGDREPESANRCADYVSETMTHEDAQEIIRLLKRIDKGIQHLEVIRMKPELKSCYSADVKVADLVIPSKRLLIMIRDSLCYEYQSCHKCLIAIDDGDGSCKCPLFDIIQNLRCHE